MGGQGMKINQILNLNLAFFYMIPGISGDSPRNTIQYSLKFPIPLPSRSIF